jgi:hypothetical protein
MASNGKTEYINSRDLDSLVDALSPKALPALVRSVDKHGHGFWGSGGHAQVIVTLDQYFYNHHKEFAKVPRGHAAHLIDVSFFIGMYLGSVLTSLRAQGLKPVERKRGADDLKKWEAAVSAQKARGKRRLQFETAAEVVSK